MAFDESSIIGIFLNISQLILFLILFWQLKLKKELFVDLFGPFLFGLQISMSIKIFQFGVFMLNFWGLFGGMFVDVLNFLCNVGSNVIYFVLIEKYLSYRNLFRIPAISSFFSSLLILIMQITDRSVYDYLQESDYTLTILYFVILVFEVIFEIVLGACILQKRQERPGLWPTCSWIGWAILCRILANIALLFFSTIVYFIFRDSSNLMMNIAYTIVGWIFWSMNIIAINKIGQITN